jgi:hypothetical protein
MNEKLDEQLCARYPKIFVNRHADMTITAMCWGISCGDGWYNILDQLCHNIQSHTNWQNRETAQVAQVVATQVKEKFGGLRFYYDGGDDYIQGLTAMAESMSEVTCETCGAPGKQRGGGWVYTACDAHTQPEHLTEQELI